MSEFSEIGFKAQIGYELKRAERYRSFVSLVIFNISPIIGDTAASESDRAGFLGEIRSMIRHSVREVDAVSNSSDARIGLLLPETPRQGAEAAARRLTGMLNRFCADHFSKPAEYLLPIEISSFPDAAGARSISSYMEEFSGN